MKGNIVFNPATLTFEYEKGMSAKKRGLLIALVVIAACAMMPFYFWLFNDVLHFTSPKLTVLKAQNARLESQLDLLTRELDTDERVLSGIEVRDDKVYRSIYGLNNVPEVVSRGGNRFAYLEEKGANPSLVRLVLRVDNLEKRASLQSKALDEVGVVSREAGDMISAIPAVPPILPEKGTYTLSSNYGYRIDPVYGGRAYHKGQDFAGKVGVPIYATGDGVVESVEFQFRGYGNEVVIDHGYGYKTRYAHLNTIEVQKGMKIRRGEKIGTMGRTGKATGPHLHYEVIYKGNSVNPRSYFDMDMPVSEYKAMIEKRVEESPVGKQSSTSELIKKRNGEKR